MMKKKHEKNVGQVYWLRWERKRRLVEICKNEKKNVKSLMIHVFYQ